MKAVKNAGSGGERRRGRPEGDLRRLGADEGNFGLFFARLGGAMEDLRQGFMELYGEGEGAETGFRDLLSVLETGYRKRPKDLKARDAAAEGRGPWYLEPGLTAYMLYLDRFASDFRGLEKRLGWLEDLGIGLVHLMPFMKTPPGNSDGGYAVSDYLEVDPRFGQDADLEETARLLHRKGMYLAADLVLNHTADDHPWARAAGAGDRKYRNYYHIFPDRTLPDRFEAAMPEVFPDTAPGNFTWVPAMEAWVMTVFHSFQWDLNWANPEVFVEMLAIAIGMANRGIDLIRLDAVPFLWKKEGTSCRNLPEAHLIVRLLKAATAVVAPELAFLAEAIVQPSEIVRYLDSEGRAECQLAYHASLMALFWEALATKKTKLLALSFGGETRLAPGTVWLSYARCHDDIGLGYDDDLIRQAGYDPALHRRFLVDWYTGRFPGSTASGRPFMENPETGDARISGTCASLCGLERAVAAGDESEIELSLRRIELLHGLISSLVGIPMVFSGDELASTNDYAWEDSPHHAEDNRWMHRPWFDWGLAIEARRGKGREGRVYRWIAKCFALRRSLAALAADAPFEVLPSSESLLVVKRVPPREAGGADAPVLVVANFTASRREFRLDGPALGLGADPVDLLGADAALDAEGLLVLGPYAQAWISGGPALSPARVID